MIIGIAGAAGVGKDTAAAYIARRLTEVGAGHGGMRVSIADPLKVALVGMMATIDPDIQHKCWGESPRRAEVVHPDVVPVSVRHLLESLSTWTDDAMYPGVVAAIALHAVLSDDSGRSYVIADVRRAIEMRILRDQGHELWHLTRPGHRPRAWERDLGRHWLTPWRKSPIERLRTAYITNSGDEADLHKLLEWTLRARLGHLGPWEADHA